MVAFARYLPIDVPRIALVDFNNDTVGDSLVTAAAFWEHYRAAFEAYDAEGQRRFVEKFKEIRPCLACCNSCHFYHLK